MIAAPIVIISAIPLGIWAHRLRKHDEWPPPSLGRARLLPYGPGLRIDF
jgi:hypothetical protein